MAPAATSTVKAIKRDIPFAWEGKDKRGNRIQTGTDDQVALWKCSWTTYEELDGKDADYKGLKSRDFVVTRHGTGMKTKYRIEPAMNAEGESVRAPMSEHDKELEAEGKTDKAKGDLHNAAGDVKDAARKVADSLRR